MKNTYFTLILTIVTFYSCGNPEKSDIASNDFLIHSKALNEDREIYVKLPPNYDSQNREYSVVYVLDGEWNFEYIASYLEYMYTNGTYPEMIVTGIKNVNRNRDYVPKRDEYFYDTGEADRFLSFVKTEWIEEIEKKFSTSKERVLVGHSFGGVFTLHSFFTEPSLFDAYLALGTSAWIADFVLIDEAKNCFSKPLDSNPFVYMAVGEGDGGPTVPSSQQLAKVFEDEAPSNLEWYFDITSKTDHFKNFISGTHEGFMALFPAWEFASELTDIAKNQGAEGVNQWFSEKQNNLGIRFHPSWFDIGVVALSLAQQNNKAAIAIINNLKFYYPENGHVANFAAMVFESDMQYVEALKEYERAIEIVKEQNLHPNSIHMEDLESGIKRIQKKIKEKRE